MATASIREDRWRTCFGVSAPHQSLFKVETSQICRLRMQSARCGAIPKPKLMDNSNELIFT